MNHRLSFSCFIVLTIVGTSCGSRPAANSGHLTPGADHAKFTNDCGECHLKDKPLAVAGLEHGTGKPCAECHLYDIDQAWQRKPYSHSPTPTSCAGCHGPKKPSNQTHKSDVDCVGCHNSSSWK